jgi:transposase-like protein
MQILYAFGIDLQVYQCMKLMPHLDEKTIIDWFGFFRDACSNALLRNPVRLGSNTGVDTNIVEIDESLFGKKRKYNRGTGNQKYWVFGMLERGTRNSVLQLVERRDRQTLLPIIKAHVEEGSTIYSDQWAAYFTLKDEGYTHLTVNHSEEFMSAEGCCTNGIEGLWGLAKLRIKKMKGVLPCRLPIYLDEFMYRYTGP